VCCPIGHFSVVAGTVETVDQVLDSADQVKTKRLTSEELIHFELQGKFQAVARYDSMLWKIRSGYAVVLYGALVIVGGTEFNISSILGNSRFLIAAILLIWGLACVDLSLMSALSFPNSAWSLLKTNCATLRFRLYSAPWIPTWNTQSCVIFSRILASLCARCRLRSYGTPSGG